MEDVGELPANDDAADDSPSVGAILDDLSRSVLLVGRQQRVVYREIFVGMRHVWVNERDTGCAMVVCPYFSLAQRAIPRGGVEALQSMSLGAWEAEITEPLDD
jgi:histidine decarboxylase